MAGCLGCTKSWRRAIKMFRFTCIVSYSGVETDVIGRFYHKISMDGNGYHYLVEKWPWKNEQVVVWRFLRKKAWWIAVICIVTPGDSIRTRYRHKKEKEYQGCLLWVMNCYKSKHNLVRSPQLVILYLISLVMLK